MTASTSELSPDSSAAIVSEETGEHLADLPEGAAARGRPAFLRRDRVGAFLSIALSGQLVYAAFEALKGSLMLQVSDVLGIGIDGFGAMMSVIGLAMYMYVPAGWINNRFTIRSILVTWCAWRLVTLLVLYLIPGLSFTTMLAIAFSWAVWDAIGWPAVVNGLTFISRDDRRRGRGLVMGFFEAIRRSVEFILAMIVVGCVWAFPQHWKVIIIGFAVGYSLLLVPLIACLLHFVPRNAIAHQDNTSTNAAALLGLLKVMTRPRIWLAGLAAMCLYWAYVNLIYSSAGRLSTARPRRDAARIALPTPPVPAPVADQADRQGHGPGQHRPVAQGEDDELGGAHALDGRPGRRVAQEGQGEGEYDVVDDEVEQEVARTAHDDRQSAGDRPPAPGTHGGSLSPHGRHSPRQARAAPTWISSRATT